VGGKVVEPVVTEGIQIGRETAAARVTRSNRACQTRAGRWQKGVATDKHLRVRSIVQPAKRKHWSAPLAHMRVGRWKISSGKSPRLSSNIRLKLAVENETGAALAGTGNEGRTQLSRSNVHFREGECHD
jgi:hypothetical protein